MPSSGLSGPTLQFLWSALDLFANLFCHSSAEFFALPLVPCLKIMSDSSPRPPPDFQPFFPDFSREMVYCISLPERLGLPMVCVKITSSRACLGLKAVNYKISLFTDMSCCCNCLNISSLSKTNKNSNNTTYVLKHAFFFSFSYSNNIECRYSLTVLFSDCITYTDILKHDELGDFICIR